MFHINFCKTALLSLIIIAKTKTQQNKTKNPNFYLKKKQQFAGQFWEVNLFPFSKINGETVI